MAHVTFLRSRIPAGATWSVCGLGRDQLPMNMLSIVTDGHTRTGLEDNVYYSRGVLAESNAQLVERVVRVAAVDWWPASMTTPPITCKTVHGSCSTTTASTSVTTTCNWITGAVKFTPAAWLAL